jgi:hypothetical protein
MRKFLFSLMIAIVILFLMVILPPFFMGMLAASKCNQLVDTINTYSPVNVQIVSYHRSWFSADATAVVSLKQRRWLQNDKVDAAIWLQKPELRQFTINAHISHGPVIMNMQRIRFAQALVDATVNLTDQQNNLLKRSNDAGPIAKARFVIQLSGKSILKSEGVPLSYQDADTNFNWQGFHLQMELSPTFSKLKTEFDLPGFNFSQKDNSVKLDGLMNSFVGFKTAEGLWAGERTLILKTFNMQTNNKHSLNISGLVMHVTANEDHNLLNYFVTTNLDLLDVDGALYQGNVFNFNLKQLNKGILAQLDKQFIAMEDTDQTSLQQAAQSFSTLVGLLNAGAILEVIQCNTTTPWGKLFATMNLNFSSGGSNAGFLAVIANSVLGMNIKANQNLVLHILEKFYQSVQAGDQPTDAATKQAQAMLAEWQQAGKVVTEGNDTFINLELNYKNHQLLLNNKPLELTIKH